MDNLIDIYSKLRLNVGSTIIVTYYSNDGFKYTKEYTLLNITNFSNILVSDNNELINIPFFSTEIIIESIRFKNSSSPLYFNPYPSKYNKPFSNYKQLKEIMDSFLEIDNMVLIERDEAIDAFLSTDELIEYDKLFFSKREKEEFEIFFNMLIEELSNYAIKNGFDPNLKKYGVGATSIIYEIGDKIIKIGKPRRNSTIPYCEYLLQPIINRIFLFDGYPIHVEITQKAFVLDNKDGFASLSHDERFNEIVSVLSTSLYSIGLSSDDLHPGNVGILLNDNKIHFDEIPFDTTSDEVTSIENNNNLRILPKGRFVIIDLDSLEIEDPEKYSKYLKSIGYNKDKTRTLKPAKQ